MKITQNVITMSWGAHAPSRAGDGALAIANFFGRDGLPRLQRSEALPRGRGKEHARARALPGAFAVICLFLCATAFAQNADNIADREVQRRQAAIPAGEAALARGKSAMSSKNYTVAYQEFKTAVAYLPDAVVSGRAHDDAAEGVCKSGTVLAEARIAQGDYAGAEAILNEILTRYDPNCRKAQELLAHMRQPGYFNKSVDAGFINKVEEVKRLLAEADGFYQSGQYDKAMKRYDQVLTLDPYNTAARRGQERIDNTKYQYGEEAYNETRARHLWKVEEAWQQPVRKYGAVGPVADNKGRGGEVRGTAQMTNKMNSIIIPHIEFRDTTIREAIDFLREQAAENDPSGQGVNIVLRLVPLGQIAPPSVPVLPPPTGAGTPVAGAPAQAPPAGAPAQGAPGGSPGVPPIPVVSGPGRRAHHGHARQYSTWRSAAVRCQSGGIESQSGTVCSGCYSAHRAKQ